MTHLIGSGTDTDAWRLGEDRHHGMPTGEYEALVARGEGHAWTPADEARLAERVARIPRNRTYDVVAAAADRALGWAPR